MSDDRFGKPTSSKHVHGLLMAAGLPPGKLARRKGLFGTYNYHVAQPGFIITASHGTSPVKLSCYAGEILTLGGPWLVADTDMLRKAADALSAAGLPLHYWASEDTGKRPEFSLYVGRGLRPEVYRPNDMQWQTWIRDFVARTETRERPEHFDITTAEMWEQTRDAVAETNRKVTEKMQASMKAFGL